MVELSEIEYITDSLIQAIMAEPERFLAYIKAGDWGKIYNLKDFLNAFIKAFSPNRMYSKNIYSNPHWTTAVELLWKNKFTQKVVDRNLKAISKRGISKEQVRVIRVKRADEYPVKKMITVTMPTGKTYKKSYRSWSSHEEEWLNRNKNTKPEILYNIYNSLFKNRTKSSIVSKRKRLIIK